MKNWKTACKEIWQDDDGWWATLKEGYVGVDEATVINGEDYQQLVEAATDIHRRPKNEKTI